GVREGHRRDAKDAEELPRTHRYLKGFRVSQVKPINVQWDDRGLFVGPGGIEQSVLDRLCEWLEAVRHEILEVDERQMEAGEIPAEKKPLDVAFVKLPERILEAYRQQSDQSELGRILRLAENLRQMVDRVVVLGIGGSYMGARALME